MYTDDIYVLCIWAKTLLGGADLEPSSSFLLTSSIPEVLTVLWKSGKLFLNVLTSCYT